MISVKMSPYLHNFPSTYHYSFQLKYILHQYITTRIIQKAIKMLKDFLSILYSVLFIKLIKAKNAVGKNSSHSPLK